MAKHELIDVAVTLRHETKNAYLIFDGDKQVWLPKSQVELEHIGCDAWNVKVTMPEWLATDKGLI